MMSNEWLTPAEAGAILGVGPDRVAQLAREGVLGSMRTPGGHVRVRRQEVEELANPPQEPPAEEPEAEEAEESPSEATRESANSSRPRWEQIPPWKRRVREAEADIHVLELDDQRERLLEGRAERQFQREQVQRERAAEQAEAERLRQLKSCAMSFLPYGVPAAVQAEVARQLERGVTSQQYPAGLAWEHTEALLRADVERYLRPWQIREARRAQVRDEARERETIIAWAVFRAGIRAPQDWDYATKKALEREVRNVLMSVMFEG